MIPPARQLIASRHVLAEAAQAQPTPAALVVARGLIQSVHPLGHGSDYAKDLATLAHTLAAEAPGGGPALPIDDLGDALLTPAFIDAHVHLGLVSLRGANIEGRSQGNVVEQIFYRFESGLSAQDVRAFVTVGAYEALLHGTGLCWEHYFFGETVADALSQTGLCAVVAPTLQELRGPGVPQLDNQLQATLAIHQRAGQSAPGRSPTWAALGAHATDTVSAALWSQVGALAERHGLPVHAHLAQSIQEHRRVRARDGLSPAALLVRQGVVQRAPSTLLVHGLYLSADDLSGLRAAGGDRVRLGFCPRSQQIFGFAADPARFEAAGIPWALGTDCAASNDAVSIPRELAVLAALRGSRVAHAAPFSALHTPGCDPDEAPEALFRARQAAQADALAQRAPDRLLAHVWDIPGRLHPQFRAGCLQPGALANLIAWDRDHPTLWPGQDAAAGLVRGAPEAAIVQVMTAGEWRGVRGDYARSMANAPAYREAAREAHARRDALLSR